MRASSVVAVVRVRDETALALVSRGSGLSAVAGLLRSQRQLQDAG